MERVEAEGSAPAERGWPGGGLQEVEPTQRVITRRARAKAKAWSTSEDPYELLGVKRGATAREIRAAYLRLVKEHHPDRHAPDAGGRDGDDVERLKAINAAYRKLKAAGAGERGWMRGRAVLFAAGVLTSLLPLLAIFAASLGGWLQLRAPAPRVAIAQESPGGQIGAGSTSVQKDSVVGRQAAFAEAKRQATKAGWAKFIADYPGGEPEAYARRALAAIEQAEALEARRHGARLAWAAAQRAGTREALARFLETHSDAEDASQASKALADIAEVEARAELASWAKAESDGTKAALEQYLAAYPSGRHVQEARTRMAELEAEDRDEEAWRAALRGNGKADFANYVQAHPKGRRTAEAEVRIAELERAEAVKEARLQPVKAPSVRSSPRQLATEAEPFVGADGRIRR